MNKYFSNKSILITGGVGSVGTELVNQLLNFDVKEIIIIDNNESEVFFANERFKDSNVNALVGDITNRDFIYRHTKDVDIVFHTAALKHVILGERSPESIVSTNIVGLQNVLDASLDNDVEKFVFTSSDKAVNPTNAMGTSKLMGERLVTAMNNKRRGKRTIFCSTRFGNVIGSKGSVFPVFKNQILQEKDITITDSRMTRFIMTLEEAAKLILSACVKAEGGEVFVTKMPVIKIQDLAVVMRDDLANSKDSINIIEIGSKPGEKLYEELMTEEEVPRSHEIDNFFVVLPAFSSLYENLNYSYTNESNKLGKAYHSAQETPLSYDEIHNFLKENNLL